MKVAAVVDLKPDLIVAALTDAPLSVLPSGTFLASATIKNQGVAASLASTTKFNLVSADGQTRKNLKGVQSVGALAAGASSADPAVTLKVYSDTVPGAYLFQACADGDEGIAEVVETNNCVTLPRGIEVRQSPDLVATAVSDPPETATQGQSIDVTSTIQNVGTVTSIETTTRYYLVATDGSGKLDLKGKPILPAIKPGRSFTETGHGDSPTRDGSRRILPAGLCRLQEGPGREEREQQLHHLGQVDSRDGAAGPGGDVGRAEGPAANQSRPQRGDYRGGRHPESGPGPGGANRHCGSSSSTRPE